MRERIRAVRKHTKLNQTEFGGALGVSLSAVQKWESGENDVSDAVIRLICREFGVSESWLRTGEGEMFTPRTREEELGAYVAKVFREDTPEFRRRLLSVLVRLDDTGREVLEKIVDALTQEKED